MRARRVASFLLFGLATSGCTEPLGPDPIAQRLQNTLVGPRLSLSGAVVRDSVGVPTAKLVFTNIGTVPDTAFFGACAFAARLYETSTADPVLWESIPAEPLPCIDIGYLIRVNPGQDEIVTAARIAAGFGVAAPPAGSHFAVVAVVANSRLRLLSAGQVTTP